MLAALCLEDQVAGDVHVAHEAARGRNLDLLTCAWCVLVETRRDAPLGRGWEEARAGVARWRLVAAPVELVLVVVSRRGAHLEQLRLPVERVMVLVIGHRRKNSSRMGVRTSAGAP